MSRIQCPACGRSGKLPVGIVRGTVNCPGCGHKFPVGGPSHVPPDEDLEFTVASKPRVIPPPMPDVLFKECPFCAEPILAAAKKCKHCGEALDPVLRSQDEMRRVGGHAPVQQVTVTSVQPPIGPRPYHVNHLAHILLSIVTCGLWLPIWFLDVILHPNSD